MYRYLDRPFSALDDNGRLIAWAMRRWVWAVQEKRCPVSAVGPAFYRPSLMPALAPFHRFMSVLCRHARQTLSFGPTCCRHVAEGEAILLVLLADFARTPPTAMAETASLIVESDHIQAFQDALTQLAETLGPAGMLPGDPVAPARLP